MCGFAGIAYLGGPIPLSSDTFRDRLGKAADAIRHRGPDDAGVWVSPDRRVGLVFRRLAILDLSANGHQPMTDRSGNVIAFNGEIYNFATLRSRYPESEYRGHSDTEVLLKGLTDKGVSLIPELDGMFAFAYYSEAKRELTLAVDPAGKKPLYTYWDGKIFAFASEIKALYELDALDFSVDRELLKESFFYGYVPWPNTIYRFIRKLPAGHSQTISLSGSPGPVQCYWDVPLGLTDEKTSLAENENRLRDLLGDAVSKRLIADVPIGCFLSGGVDSSAITLEAARRVPRNSLRTFGAGFSYDAYSSLYDETGYAEQVAQMVGTQHTSLQIDAGKIDAQAILKSFDEPFGDSSAIPTYLLCKETARYLKVVLSGDGGDELFGGYLRFRGALMSERYKTLWQWALSPVMLIKPNARSFLGKVKRFRNAVSEPLLRRLALWNSFFGEEELGKYLGETSESALARLRYWDDRTAGLPIGEKILYYNFKTYLFDDLLPKVDRMSMAHGLEVRSPFLDKALIEFAFRLPTRFKFDAFRTKIILKNAYRGELGREVVDRAKHGFGFPLETFLRDKAPGDSFSLRSFFPRAPLSVGALNPLNVASKKFMLFSLDQCLSQATTRYGYGF